MPLTRLHCRSGPRFAWEDNYTCNEWLDQLPTHGHLDLLPPDKLATVLQGIGAAIASARSPTARVITGKVTDR